jgi:hypothetical protein
MRDMEKSFDLPDRVATGEKRPMRTPNGKQKKRS